METTAASTTMDAAASSASISSVLASASSILASASSASASAESLIASATGGSAAQASERPASYRVVGLILAISSGLFIGSSFVFKKKGLLAMQKKSGFVAGEGHAYLKSPMWWTGMTCELANTVAYAFTDAILVTPMGALSVVICAVLSSIFLKEKLTFFGKIGCVLCVLGAVIIALNGPEQHTSATINEFKALFLGPGFLAFGSIVIVVSLGLMFWAGPRYGKKNMLVYILICSLIGGLSVVCTSGLGSSIVTSINGNNQFKNWFIYFLLVFVVVTLLTEINYLNKALELFNTAMVTPTYYVIFTASTLITDVILHKGFKASPTDIVTVVFGFFVICCGITLLQMSKIDPQELENKVKLDRKSTLLMRAASTATRGGRTVDSHGDEIDNEKDRNLDLEDPGVDAVRGFVGVAGSIHRALSARRTISQRRRQSELGSIYEDSPYIIDEYGNVVAGGSGSRRQRKQPGLPHLTTHGLEDGGVTRHQLYDAPMPLDAADRISQYTKASSPTSEVGTHGHAMTAPSVKSPTKIEFNDHVVEHLYPRIGQEGQAIHHQISLHDKSGTYMHHQQQPLQGILQNVSEFGQHLQPPQRSNTSASTATNTSILDAYSPTAALPLTPSTARPKPAMRAQSNASAATAGSTSSAGSGSSATGGSVLRANKDNRSLSRMISEHMAADTHRSRGLAVDTEATSRLQHGSGQQRSPRQKSPSNRSFFGRRRAELDNEEEESMGLVGHSAEFAGSQRAGLSDAGRWQHPTERTRNTSARDRYGHAAEDSRESTDVESDRDSRRDSVVEDAASDGEAYQMQENLSTPRWRR